MHLNVPSPRIHIRTFRNSVQPLAQEDTEAFLGYTGRMQKVEMIRKLSFVALKLLNPPSESEAESVQPVFLLILIYVYRHCDYTTPSFTQIH